MMKKKYTVAEIDDLRSACDKRYLFGSSCPQGIYRGQAYNEHEKNMAVEQMVQTFMQGGVTADDVRKEDMSKVGTSGFMELSSHD